MNWKEELEDMFQNRKREHTVENYWKARNEVILPAFKEIKDLLKEYEIQASIDNSNVEFKVDGCGFIMKAEMDVDNIKFTFKYLSPIAPDEMPPLKPSIEKYTSIQNLTIDDIGTLFMEAFRSMKKFYTLTK